MRPRRIEAVALQVFGRQVVAATHDVEADVLPEVDQLQGRADSIALRLRRCVADAIQMKQQPADRVGAAPAIVKQFPAACIARAVAAADHVLFKSRQQVPQRPLRQHEVADRAAQWNENAGPTAAVGPAGEAGIEIGAEVGEG